MSMASANPASLMGCAAPFGIPEHELVMKIGRGSYGEVWLGRNAVGSQRAVKIIHRGSFEDDRPFEREFNGIKNFEPISRSHPGFVNILQVGRIDEAGYFYYVMELADDASDGKGDWPQTDPPGDRAGRIQHRPPFPPEKGRSSPYLPQTLRGEMERLRAFPLEDCISLGLTLTAALSCLHRAGFVHRDIKPSNIIFVGGRPKLADIGLVSAAGEGCSFVGTEEYVPPEGPGRAPADIYALGKVLYEMVTGKNVKEYPSLPDWWATDPAHGELSEFMGVVLRACEGKQEFRYRSADEMKADLEFLQLRKSLFLKEMLRKFRRMQQVLLLGGGLLVLGGLGGVLWYYRNEAAQQTRGGILKEFQIAKTQTRFNGWFEREWGKLKALKANDPEIIAAASSLLGGLDAHAWFVTNRYEASSAVFGPDGSVLVGGTESNPAVRIHSDGSLTELPLVGSGPVAWPGSGGPLQLLVGTNRLVLSQALTGEMICEFDLAGANPAHTDSKPVLALSLDGKLVAASLGERTIVWNADARRPTGELKLAATALGFSPDGALLAAGTRDGTTYIHPLVDLPSGIKLPPALRGNPILAVAFGRDPTILYNQAEAQSQWLLAVGDQGAGIVVWDLNKKMPRAICRGSTWIVSALAFSPDGMLLASAGRTQHRLWDVATGECLLFLEESSSGTSLALAFDMEGKRLVSGGLAGAGKPTTAIWELDINRGIQVFRGLTAAVRKVWLSPSGGRIAALSDGWRLAVWDVGETPYLRFVFETPTGMLTDNADACFNATGESLVFATGQEAILYDLESGEALRRWALRQGRSDQVRFDRTGRMVLARREQADGENQLVWRVYQLADSAAATLLFQQDEKDLPPEGLAMSPDGDLLILWSGTPGAYVLTGLDLHSGKRIWEAKPSFGSKYLRLRFDPLGSEFAFTDDVTRQMNIIRAQGFTKAGTTAKFYQAIRPSQDLFVGIEEDDVVVESISGQPSVVLSGWRSTPDSLVFTRGGKGLAWGMDSGPVILANLDMARRWLNECEFCECTK